MLPNPSRQQKQANHEASDEHKDVAAGEEIHAQDAPRKHNNGLQFISGLCSGDSYYNPKFLSSQEAKRYFDVLMEGTNVTYEKPENMTFKIYGKTMQLSRKKAFWGEVRDVMVDGKHKKEYPLYRYGGNYEPLIHPWHPVVKEICDRLRQVTGFHVNHCVQNLYESGVNYIGPHRDKTRDFAEGAPVFTISLGCVRKFRLEKISSGKAELSIDLQPGSVFCLGPLTNQAYKHSIQKTSAPVGPRISLTFRVIKTKALRDPTEEELEQYQEAERARAEAEKLEHPTQISGKKKKVKEVILSDQTKQSKYPKHSIQSEDFSNNPAEE